MKEIRVKFIERIRRTPTVESFRFQPQEPLDFLPGQFLQIIFDETNRGNKELNKYLSFSSSPTKPYIEVTKRLSQSVFSARLNSLKIGDEVLIKAAMGTCVFDPADQKIGFLIGGIGITPVMSILEYIVAKNLSTQVHLVYSNRTDDEIAFRRELDAWKREYANIKVSYTLTECQPKDNTCLFGAIDQKLLYTHVCDLAERVIFIFGPPRMVEAMRQLSLDLGCATNRVKVENFVGY
ncbi:MAG TPA: FAD-binding oxidoreductase [Candidatus Omnitrophota bacterium]|nr:FAD-binding oxidoreductase [Candidatus Omnitrophota bacterium]HPT07875.1 FAD-binding oxidoreductase [Candidatus Omnitrophota bacterium]